MGEEMFLFKIPKEEWITIADTTLTEEVASLEFTTDINGNPFKCKKVVADIVLANNHGVANDRWYFGVNTRVQFVFRQTGGQMLTMECCGDFEQYALYPHAYNVTNTTSSFAFRPDKIGSIGKVILIPPTDNPLISGDSIKIWGLKA